MKKTRFLAVLLLAAVTFGFASCDPFTGGKMKCENIVKGTEG